MVLCLQDLRLLFKLKQQQFVEELRKGTPESKRDALGICPSPPPSLPLPLDGAARPG